MRLILGVTDISYSEENGGATTTGEVAQILEDRYHVMEVFAIEHEDEIAEDLAQAMVDQIQDIASGAPVPRDPFLDATESIRMRFQTFIETEEIARINPDTPTQAALEGRTKRRKGGKGPRRVSFRDTGTYMASMRAWIEQGHMSLSAAFPIGPGLGDLWSPSL
ncbi:MAG: hypothetical protein KGL39_47885 [Patescibacteria group bacterium]|nr:hypothetical protein [Patescibacteria group bacterium]